MKKKNEKRNKCRRRKKRVAEEEREDGVCERERGEERDTGREWEQLKKICGWYMGVCMAESVD